MSLFVEGNPLVFLFLTLIIGGGAAFMAGRGMAIKWRPLWMTLFASVLLTLGLRFLHFALFEGQLTSVHYLITDFIVVAAFAVLGHRTTLAKKMVRQYPWLYEKTGPLNWRAKV